MRAYRSARGVQQTVDALLAAQIALLGLRVLGWIVVTIAGASELSRMVVRGVALSSPFLVALFLATTVAFLAWVYRAAANLPALGVASRPLEPGLAVALFFVPLGNLFAAPWVLHALWAGSDPTPPPERRSRLLLTGWALALALAYLAAATVADPRWGGARTAAAWALLSPALSLVAALACLTIVRAVQARQDAQWEDLEQRRAVPAPLADRLR
jgi:hypothetical protein